MTKRSWNARWVPCAAATLAMVALEPHLARAEEDTATAAEETPEEAETDASATASEETPADAGSDDTATAAEDASPRAQASDTSAAPREPEARAQAADTSTRTEAPPPEPPPQYRDPWAGHSMRPRIAFRPMFGFGGTARIDRVAEDPELATSYGGAIEIEVPVVPFFSLAGEVALLAWTTDGDQEFDLDRNLLTSISLVPRLRLPFEGEQIHGAMYLGVPVGISINAMDDTFDEPMNIVGADLGTGVGYNVGARLGAQVFFTPRFGITAELEYRYHAFRHNLDGGLLMENQSIDVSVHQLILQTGLVFTL